MTSHFFGNGTVTLVWLSTACNGRLVPTKKARVSGPADIRKLFPLSKGGDPVVGPRVMRELTNAELQEKGLSPSLKKDSNSYCLFCLVPIGAGQNEEKKEATAA